MRLSLPPPMWLRAACLVAFAAFLVQLFVLDEPRVLADLTNATWDKLMHAFAFGAAALLLWVAIGFRAPALAWVAIVVIGALDEYHQLFVPGRQSDIGDVVADAVGAACMILVLQALARAPRGAGATALDAAIEVGD